MKNKKSIRQSILIADIIAEYLTGTLSENRQIVLNEWLQEHPRNLELFKQLTNNESLRDDICCFNEFDEDIALIKVKKSIASHLSSNKEIKSVQHKGYWWNPIFNNLNIKVISLGAAALLILTPFIWISSHKDNTSLKESTDVSISQIVAAKIGATLKLPNGKIIRLDNATQGQIVKDLGVLITKTGDGQLVYEISSGNTNNTVNDSSLNILTTERGETYSVKLPDGTIVKLNSASRLEYPMNFLHASKRKVKLIGEAYFQVAHNSAKPFIIVYKNQTAEVLGTEFNINAYDNEEKTIVTLVHGLLRVDADNNQSSLLTPGNAAIFYDNTLKTIHADMSENTAWKDGIFYFNKTPFDAIARQISRWYDIDISYVNNKVPNIKFSGEMRRDVSLSTILAYFEELGIKFKLDKRKLIIQ